MKDVSLVSHLEDLRQTLIKALAGLLVGVILAFFCVSFFLKFLSAPYLYYLQNLGIEGHLALRSLGPADTFQVTLKAALLFGVGLSSPWIVYQFWLFVAPALYKKEKGRTFLFCALVIFFFLLGLVFAYYAVLPLVISFFYSYSVGMGITPDWTVTHYYNFVIGFLGAFGVIFELPVVMVTLAWLGMVDDKLLVAYRRHAIVGIFIVAAALTPPDVISQLMMGLPMLLLYELSIFAVKFVKKDRRLDRVNL